MKLNDYVLFDAGLFIGALFRDDPRYAESRPLVESGRNGDLPVCTTTGILSEIYAALTWTGAPFPCSPEDAATAVRLLIEPPSHIKLIHEASGAALKMLELAEKHSLKARRIHDARHAAAAIMKGISKVYTYDTDDWKVFVSDGLTIAGPNSVLSKLK
jgi:predicted nucleic acid-binding protein